MIRSKPTLPPKMVWRISESAPMGEWVKPRAQVKDTPAKGLPEVSYGTWVTSSYDLLDGADVIEDPDTIPGDLLDELFAPKLDVPEKP
jgi:hypothetical protein